MPRRPSGKPNVSDAPAAPPVPPPVTAAPGVAPPATPPVPGRTKGSWLKKKQKTVKKPEKPAQPAPSKEPEVVYDESDPTLPLPVGLKLYCKHGDLWHEVVILERKEKNPEVFTTMLPLPGLPGIPGIPGVTPPPEAIEQGTIVTGQWGGHKDLPALEGPQPMDDSGDEAKKRKQTTNGEHNYLYYLHFVEWDRRMDQWVARDKLSITQPKVKQPKIKYISDAGLDINSPFNAESNIIIIDEDDEKDEDEADDTRTSTQGAISGGGNTHGHGGHGSFTEEDVKAHEAATKVKNIDMIVLGKYQITTWYYSPFPEEYNQYGTLYFCEFCLSFFGYASELARHSQRCTLRHPPGNEIYRSQDHNVDIAVFEVDGQKEVTYCQNLSYIAKLFLDHKTLEYDCHPFLFYVLCEVDARGCHLVGYFSKEKVSVAKYNLACILTLPCHQRKGYGKFIISLSYELSKIEEKVGSPEKPISDLGKVSYLSYWTGTLVAFLNERPLSTEISIEEISRQSCITTADIIETLKYLKVLVWYKGKWTFSTNRLQEVAKRQAEKEEHLMQALLKDPASIRVNPCNPEKLHWTPFFANKRTRHMQGGKGGKG